jgi:hypothetical protein
MMRHLGHAVLAAALVALGAGCLAAPATAEVPQSIGAAVKPSSDLPPLKLSDAQRARIATVIGTKDTDVSFALKQAKKSKSFQPKVGDKLPSGLKPLALPPPLIYEMPALKQYGYLKFKDQIVIVNPMTQKIVVLLPFSKV